MAKTYHTSYRFIFFTYFLLLSTFSFSQDSLLSKSNDRQAGEALKELMKSHQTFQASFIQNVRTLETIEDPEVKKGTLAFKQPTLLRLSQTDPWVEEHVLDGQVYWYYDPDLQQVIKRPSADLDSSVLLFFFGSVDDILKRWKITYTQQKENLHIYTGVPITDEGILDINFIFKNKELRAVVVNDGQGQNIEFLFKDIKINYPLKNKYFKFSVPRGVEVIE